MDQLRALLSQLAEVTGGRAYFAKNVKQCEQACIAIAKELREQCSLDYYPRPKLLDGSWRSVQVQQNLPEQPYQEGLTLRTRAGIMHLGSDTITEARGTKPMPTVLGVSIRIRE